MSIAPHDSSVCLFNNNQTYFFEQGKVSVKAGQLVMRSDGSLEVVNKTLPFAIGQHIVAPVLLAGSKVFQYLTTGLSLLDRTVSSLFSFPGAAAAETAQNNQHSQVADSLHNLGLTYLEQGNFP